MAQADEKAGKLPQTFKRFAARFPELAAAHQAMGDASGAGPLDEKMRELVKIGICVGAQLESALRSHVRRARQAGATEEEVEHAIVLAMSTIGFPPTVAAWNWAQVQFERDRSEAAG